MKKILILSIIALISLSLNAQNIFPVKLSTCEVDRFCMDCGEVKANYDQDDFDEFLVALNEKVNIGSIYGQIKFQVLVDSNGMGCVLSHTDKSKSKVTKKIIKELNKFNKWTPAINKDGVKEYKTSITLLFTLGDNKIRGEIERVDMDEFKNSFDRPIDPKITNKTYVYNNPNLKNYKITVWNSKNTNLPDNFNDNITIDTNDLLWLTTDESLVTFDGDDFTNAEQDITEIEDYFDYRSIATDNNNTKWVFATKNVYSYDNTNWIKYDSAEIGIDGGYEIINNPKTGEVFFCSDEGLTIYKNGKWSNINKETNSKLPSNRVCYAKRDSKNRLWIGTFSGTIMIDNNGKTTNYEEQETILKGKCITSMAEDENGNIYFTLYEFGENNSKKDVDHGIAVLSNDDSFKLLNLENSGMPCNSGSYILYDKIDNVIWISTAKAGLIRYDLKDGWEIYHNKNSAIPTSYISTMAFDKAGNLYLATRQGLVKIERR